MLLQQLIPIPTLMNLIQTPIRSLIRNTKMNKNRERKESEREIRKMANREKMKRGKIR
ncbi:hypothetical protein A2U01_0091810, partial [Trifolium medium]|nr:hypothetical protein [Trifolium medium]